MIYIQFRMKSVAEGQINNVIYIKLYLAISPL